MDSHLACDGGACRLWGRTESDTTEATQQQQPMFALSHVQLLATPWTVARQPSLSITNSWNLLKLTSIDSV